MVPVFKNNFIIKEEFFLTEDNACLEMLPNSMFDQKLVARVCRDPNFCDRNSCIRKCCVENEFFYARGCNKLTPEEPVEFYQAFANAVNQTELSTFNMSKGCCNKINVFFIYFLEEKIHLFIYNYIHIYRVSRNSRIKIL